MGLLGLTRATGAQAKREWRRTRGFGSCQIPYVAAPAALGEKEKRKAAFGPYRRAAPRMECARAYCEFPISAYRTLTEPILRWPFRAKTFDISLILNGAPERIRTSDPQIRS